MYEVVSGQKINKEKTTMTFSKNMPVDTRKRILEFWRLIEANEHSR